MFSFHSSSGVNTAKVKPLVDTHIHTHTYKCGEKNSHLISNIKMYKT